MSMSMMLLRVMKVHPTTRRECYLHRLILITVRFLVGSGFRYQFLLARHELKYLSKIFSLSIFFELRRLYTGQHLADAAMVKK